MTQNRKPPAYQEYAASMLSNREFRLMSFAERGLLFSLRLECWENEQVPTSVDELARYLGYAAAEVETAFTKRVKSFLYEREDSLTCPELDNYRQHLQERAVKQSNGGKKGAKKTNALKNNSESKENAVDSDGTGSLQVTHHPTCGSLVKISPVKQSQKQSLESGYVDNAFVTQMIEYERMSNGL